MKIRSKYSNRGHLYIDPPQSVLLNIFSRRSYTAPVLRRGPHLVASSEYNGFKFIELFYWIIFLSG